MIYMINLIKKKGAIMILFHFRRLFITFLMLCFMPGMLLSAIVQPLNQNQDSWKALNSGEHDSNLIDLLNMVNSGLGIGGNLCLFHGYKPNTKECNKVTNDAILAGTVGGGVLVPPVGMAPGALVGWGINNTEMSTSWQELQSSPFYQVMDSLGIHPLSPLAPKLGEAIATVINTQMNLINSNQVSPNSDHQTTINHLTNIIETSVNCKFNKDILLANSVDDCEKFGGTVVAK